MAVLQKVLRQKLKNFESASPLQKKKLAVFAQQRGFESELIWKLLKETKQ
jgi:SOS response regulatory protein OraA/RecX